jgi:hypothetical protein
MPIRMTVQQTDVRPVVGPGNDRSRFSGVTLMLFHDVGMGSYGIAHCDQGVFRNRMRQYAARQGAEPSQITNLGIIHSVRPNEIEWTRSKTECAETLCRRNWHALEFEKVDTFVRASIAWLYADVANAGRLTDRTLRITLARQAFWPPVLQMTPEMLREHDREMGVAPSRNPIENIERAIVTQVAREMRPAADYGRQPTLRQRYGLDLNEIAPSPRQVDREAQRRINALLNPPANGDARTFNEDWRRERERQRQRALERAAAIVYPFTYEQMNGPCTACASAYVSEGVCWDCGALLLPMSCYDGVQRGTARGITVAEFLDDSRRRPRRRPDHPSFTEND